MSKPTIRKRGGKGGKGGGAGKKGRKASASEFGVMGCFHYICNINIMNVPGDGNCMLHSCTSKLQNLLNIGDFTIQQAINMRNVLMDHLLSCASNRTASGMTLSELAMLRASEIELELKKKNLFPWCNRFYSWWLRSLHAICRSG